MGSDRSRSSVLALVCCLLLASSLAAADDLAREGSGARRAALDALEGSAPPALALTSMDGAAIQLAAQRGRVVVLAFLAHDSGPCAGAWTELARLDAAHRAGGLAVLGVHPDGDPEGLADFLRERAIAWPVAVDADGAAARALRVDALPDYYLVDRAGHLRVADLANHELARAVAVLLAEPAPAGAAPGTEGSAAAPLAELARTWPESRYAVLQASGRVGTARLSNRVLGRAAAERAARPAHAEPAAGALDGESPGGSEKGERAPDGRAAEAGTDAERVALLVDELEVQLGKRRVTTTLAAVTDLRDPAALALCAVTSGTGAVPVEALCLRATESGLAGRLGAREVTLAPEGPVLTETTLLRALALAPREAGATQGYTLLDARGARLSEPLVARCLGPETVALDGLALRCWRYAAPLGRGRQAELWYDETRRLVRVRWSAWEEWRLER